MKTNDIKKGDRIRLRNGWYGTMNENRKGNIREAIVEGFATETGSVYAHDILMVRTADGEAHIVEHTPAQLKLMATVRAMGM